MVHGSCPYCAGLLSRRSAAPWDSILADFPTCVVAPTKGSLLPGWLLVIPKQHSLCAGALTNPEAADAEAAALWSASRISSFFGPVTMFEHGPARSASPVGCGVSHSHIHVCSLPFSLSSIVAGTIPPHRMAVYPSMAGSVIPLSYARQCHRQGLDYTWIREPTGDVSVITSPPRQSQFLRRVIAAQLGCPDAFDYRLFPQDQNAQATLDRFHGHLQPS